MEVADAANTRSEVKAGLNTFQRSQGIFGMPEVSSNEFAVGGRFLLPFREVVDDSDRMAQFDQAIDDATANEAGTTSDGDQETFTLPNVTT